MNTTDYVWLGTVYQGDEAVAILAEGIKKNPDSVNLHSDYMQLLAKAGRKEEAWEAYEKARDLYFAQVTRRDGPMLPGDLQGNITGLLPPALFARQWYSYLLQARKDGEFRHLDERLREVCPKTKADPSSLILPRATAEFGSGRYAEAARSLEACLQLKLWNEFASEAMITGALARSLRALGRREDAIKSYRRAVQISDADAGLLSEFLSLVVEDQGVAGLQRELPAYDSAWLKLDVRRNATLSCFTAWAAIGSGDEKAAFEKLVLSIPYMLLATQQPAFGGEEGLICGVIHQIVSEKLGESRHLAGATAFLKRFPPDRVSTMRKLFLLPKGKDGRGG